MAKKNIDSNTYVIKENDEKPLKYLLEELGYNEITKGFRGTENKHNAILKFIKYNQKFLDFLNVKVSGEKIITSGTTGVVPLKYAIDKGEKFFLHVKPMISVNIISGFAAKAKTRDWITLNPDWRIPQNIELELWYFSFPFIEESLKVLKKRAKGFKTYESNDSYPRGTTDWNDYAVNKAPFNQIAFNNRVIESSHNVLPHCIMKWAIEAVHESAIHSSNVPYILRSKINELRTELNDVDEVVPTEKIFSKLPRSGAWSGYKNLYNEIYQLAIITGVVSGVKKVGAAYALKSERLFEEFIMYIGEKYQESHPFKFFKDTDNSSVISFDKIEGDYISKRFNMWKAIKPDVVLKSKDTLVILEVKYKKHYCLASKSRKSLKSTQWGEQMLADLHQALSYSVFSNKKKKVILLVHPLFLESQSDHKIAKYNIRKNSRDENVIIGYLPLHLNEESNIEDAVDDFHNNLDQILKHLND